MSQDAGWEHFHHEADIGVRGHGRSLAEAFEQAALAMTAVEIKGATFTELAVRQDSNGRWLAQCVVDV